MALDQINRIGQRRLRYSSPSHRRRMRAYIVAGLLMGFVALAWAWAFQRGPHEAGSDVPVLAADPQPTREKPTDPGGMKVADIDPLSYDAGRSPPKVESILPAPEKPLPQPIPEQRAAVTPPSPTDTASAAAAPPPKPADPSESTATETPAKVVPDQTASPPPPVSAIHATREPAAAPPPKPKPAAVRLEPPKAASVTPGGYRLQLASLRSAADARTTEERLRRTYGDVLGSVSFSVVSVNLGDRGTYYRVMAGPMSQGSASQICDSLRQRGAACILAKP